MADDASMVRRLAMQQRKRLLGSLMGAAEQSSWWKKLNAREQNEYRDKVRASVGTYHDFMLDVITVGREDMLQSEQTLTLLQQLHGMTKGIEQAVTNASP